MPIVLEEVSDIQFITNKSGEKTAVIISLENKNGSFRKLLTKFVETENFENVSALIQVEKAFRVLENLVQSNKDPVFLKEIGSEIENLMEKIEDDFDLNAIAERAEEKTISQAELREELNADGLI